MGMNYLHHTAKEKEKRPKKLLKSSIRGHGGRLGVVKPENQGHQKAIKQVAGG